MTVLPRCGFENPIRCLMVVLLPARLGREIQSTLLHHMGGYVEHTSAVSIIFCQSIDFNNRHLYLSDLRLELCNSMLYNCHYRQIYAVHQATMLNTLLLDAESGFL